MLTWTNILIQNIKFNFLEFIWPIQFIGKLKFKYFESNESGRCFEVQIDVKTSSSNIIPYEEMISLFSLYLSNILKNNINLIFLIKSTSKSKIY